MASAFLVGSDSDDLYINEDVTVWQCSPDTRAGDMIIISRLSDKKGVTEHFGRV